jgi:hypothetical protein
MNLCSYTNEVLCSERSFTYLQVLFESLLFSAELLNMTMVTNFEVMLGQTLCYSI